MEIWRQKDLRLLILFTLSCVLSLVCLAVASGQEAVPDYGPILQGEINKLVDPDNRWPDTGGGVVEIPRGRHTLKTSVTIPCHNITLKGSGGTHSQACALIWKGEGPMFILRQPRLRYARTGGFRVCDLVLDGNSEDPCFLFDGSDVYEKGWRFDRVAAFHFSAVMKFDNTGTMNAWGGIETNQCYFTYNGQVIDAADVILNKLMFRASDFTKNGLAGHGQKEGYTFDFNRSNTITFLGCGFGDTPKVMRATKCRNVVLQNCRFENNHRKEIEDPVMFFDGCQRVLFNCYHRAVRNDMEAESSTATFVDCEDVVSQISNLRRVTTSSGPETTVMEYDWVPID